MKPAPAFILGLATGLGLFAAFNLWRNPTHPPAPSLYTSPETKSPSTTSPSTLAPENQTTTQPDFAPAPGSLESALREIREAGMIVIPQEAARLITPSMLSSKPDLAVRAILQLDDREIAALGDVRDKFMREFQATADAHLQITEVKAGVVTAVVPAFEEERQKLLDKLRSDSLAALDTDSAAVFGFINLDRVLEHNYLGTRDITATFTPIPGSTDYRIDLKSQEQNGATRRNFRMQQTIPQNRLRTEYPSLLPHLPPPPNAQPTTR